MPPHCSREDAFNSRRTGRLEAVATLQKAATLNPLPEYNWALADALRSLKRDDEAAAARDSRPGRTARRIRGRSRSTSRRDARTPDEPSISPDASSRTGATSSRSTRSPGRWRATEESTKHRRFMTRALAEGTQDGRLFVHAAAIAAANGRRGRRDALGAQSPDAPLHPASLGAWGAPHGNRDITPGLRLSQ